MTVPHAGVGAVVIGRNEGPRLVRALESALRETEHVVYVDSGSTDDSVAAAETLGAHVVHLDLSTPFTAARARNAGIAELRGLAPDLRYVQVMDGDCELIDGWLDEAVELMESDDHIVVACGRRCEREPNASVYNRLCDMEWDTPVGDAESCGGDALLRLSAITAVGGYDPTIIAGEEPELCVRLRRKGGRVVRLDRNMTWHDAAMTRFTQWWTRAVRNGHAVAEGAWRHGRGSERFRVRTVRSILVWGGLVPLVALAAAWPTSGLSLALLAGYAWLYARVRHHRRRHGDETSDAALYARFCVLGKLAEMTGVARFHLNRLRGRRSRIIEYKTPGPRACQPHHEKSVASAGRLLYVGGTLPCRSETFVYREVLGLRRRGVEVLVASVHAPEHDLGDPDVEALAREAIPVYGAGSTRLLRDAAAALIRRPLRGPITLAIGVIDALLGRDVPATRRPRVIWQTLAGLALGRRVRSMGIVHLHAHMAHVPTTIAMTAARYLGASFSFTGHAVDLFCHRTLLATKLRRAAFVACISHWHRTFYRTVTRCADEKLPVIRCGVDPSEFHPARDRDVVTPVLLAVGRLVPKKGFDTLLRAVATLHGEGIDVRCRIIGDGPQREELELLRETLEIDDVVDLPGAADNSGVRDAMKAADLFVLPCRVDDRGDRDGIPVVLMEAMACATCVVAGDLATIRELIEPDRGGVLVEPGDAEGLADTLRDLLADPARRRRLAETGRRQVETEFALDVNVDRLLAALARVVPGLGSPVAASPFDTTDHEKEAA